MMIGSLRDVTPNPVTSPGASGATIAWLIDERKGAPTFAMRLIQLAPEGFTPRHRHAWEHEVFVLEGEGRLWGEGGWTPLAPGTYALVGPEEEHQFVAGPTGMKFLCLVPNGAS